MKISKKTLFSALAKHFLYNYIKHFEVFGMKGIFIEKRIHKNGSILFSSKLNLY